MRRAAPAIIATVAGLGLLSQFETAPGSTVVATGTAAGTSPSSTSVPRGGGRSAPATTAPTTTAPPTSKPASAAKTVDGPVVENRFGPVQVEVKVAGGKLLDVQALQLPSDRARSASISHQAGPMLRDEALQAQSANIDLISGATYTSDSYAQSLQAALDQAGMPSH